MSLLNHTSDGHYNVLLALCFHLVSKEKQTCTMMELEQRLRPTGAIPPTVTREDKDGNLITPASQHYLEWEYTISRWVQLGLFEREGEEIRLLPDLSEEKSNESDPDCLARAINRHLRRIIFDSNFNPRTQFEQGPDGEGTPSTSDLTRALAWWLAQSPLSCQPAKDADLPNLEQEQELKGFKIIQNSTRAANVLRWSRGLGFAEFWLGGRTIANPARAVADHLSEIFEENLDLSLKDFCRQAALTLPVLDGGEYRIWIEELLEEHAEGWRPPEADTLSPTMSLALLTLQEEGLLTLRREADASSGLRLWEEQLPYSHLTWNQPH
jgi:hypothetical protein